MNRTVRVTYRCNEAEKSSLSRLAATFGESESATLRRVVRAVTQHMDLLSSLVNGQPEYARIQEGVPSREAALYSQTLHLITALLTAYREAGESGQEFGNAVAASKPTEVAYKK